MRSSTSLSEIDIIYRTDILPSIEQVILLYENAGLLRPTKDYERMGQLLQNSDLIVTAWHGDRLAGIARCITDWVWSTYLADLAVLEEYQHIGIGKTLIEHVQKTVGEKSMILLLSVPSALEYYPKVGFTKQESSFIINRGI